MRGLVAQSHQDLPLELRHVEGGGSLDEEIDFDPGCKMDEIAARTLTDGPGHGLFIDIERSRQGLDETADAILAEVHHEIHVVSLAGDAVDRARVRAAEMVRNPESIQGLEHEEGHSKPFGVARCHRPEGTVRGP